CSLRFALPMTNYSGLTTVLSHLDPESGQEPAKRLLFVEEIEGHDDHQTGNGASRGFALANY
ncbi:MAG TPA: hypothetical protein VFA15_08060, partial [Nitrososphaera sp.]|nr:hypothetical protein [Nitrososphaera sp.]